MATLPSKVCHFWRSLCIVRLFFPYLATPKICQNQQNQHPNKFAIIGNICNSSKRSQMTNSFPYILNGNIGKDSVWTWTFLTTLCVVTFCQIWHKVKVVKFLQILAILIGTKKCWQQTDNSFVSHHFLATFPIKFVSYCFSIS